MTQYQCPNCGWVGAESAMEADYFIWDDEGDEVWSNWICPACQCWHQLADYKKVDE